MCSAIHGSGAVLHYSSIVPVSDTRSRTPPTDPKKVSLKRADCRCTVCIWCMVFGRSHFGSFMVAEGSGTVLRYSFCWGRGSRLRYLFPNSVIGNRHRTTDCESPGAPRGAWKAPFFCDVAHGLAVCEPTPRGRYPICVTLFAHNSLQIGPVPLQANRQGDHC